jgi:hypothetical protein
MPFAIVRPSGGKINKVWHQEIIPKSYASNSLFHTKVCPSISEPKVGWVDGYTVSKKIFNSQIACSLNLCFYL